MVNRTSTAFRATCKRKKIYSIIIFFTQPFASAYPNKTWQKRGLTTRVVTADQELLVQFSKGKKPRQGS